MNSQGYRLYITLLVWPTRKKYIGKLLYLGYDCVVCTITREIYWSIIISVFDLYNSPVLYRHHLSALYEEHTFRFLIQFCCVKLVGCGPLVNSQVSVLILIWCFTKHIWAKQKICMNDTLARLHFSVHVS